MLKNIPISLEHAFACGITISEEPIIITPQMPPKGFQFVLCIHVAEDVVLKIRYFKSRASVTLMIVSNLLRK
jgi:hypothetical protein